MSTKNKKNLTNDDSFTLTKAQVADLAQFFDGHFVTDFDDLKEHLRRACTIKLNNGIEIQLSQNDLWQIQQQSQGMGVPYEKYVHDFCEDAIQMFLNGSTVIRY